MRGGLHVVEAYAARVTFLGRGLGLLDGGEPVDKHRLADEGDGVQPEPRVEQQSAAVRKDQFLRIVERWLDALLAFALLDRNQGVLVLGNISNVSEDEAEYLPGGILSQHWHVADGVALALLAVGGIKQLVAQTGVD